MAEHDVDFALDAHATSCRSELSAAAIIVGDLHE